MTAAVTLDRFLNGRITIAQPANGFRAGHDSVLLAAAVPADPGSRVLELGSGSGVASLCLAARVPGVRISGMEIDRDLVRLANENASRNSFANRVTFISAEVSSGGGPPFEEGVTFDHVFFNPPFHPDSAHVSPVAARDRATRDSSDAVRIWTTSALRAVRDGGTVTAIIRADRADAILDAGRGYDGIVFPLLPHVGEKPKRSIVRILKRRGGTFSTATGLVLHESDGRSTESAEAVLRHGRALSIAP